MHHEQLIITRIRLLRQQVFYDILVLLLLFSSSLPGTFGLLSPLDDIAPCNNSRVQIVNSTWGVISDGSANYSQDSVCEWLIQAPDPTSLITLFVHSLRTECSYDYLFIFDGKSYRNSTLLASLSGGTKPGQPFHSYSGYMLILFYSDPNYVLEGFVAEYFATNCPLKCTDLSSCTGESKCDCEEDVVPIFANNETITKCATQHSTKDHPITVQYNQTSIIGRVDHSALLLHHSLFVFGGYDLNNYLSDMLVLKLKEGTIEAIRQDSGFWPGARRGHATAPYKNGFFIHGGKTPAGISNQLYYFDADKVQWVQFMSVGLPHLYYHTMAQAGSDIYVHGGGTPSGQFSSRLYRFHGENPSSWEIVQSNCCGKEKGRRLLGHTMNYWPKENAFVIFSGLVADVMKFAKLSSVVWIYWIDTSAWIPIEYWRLSGGFYQNIERAFHSAEIIGSHLVVVGGYTHKHNGDESCYASQVLIYNIQCHSLVPLPEIPTERGMDVEGMFGQKTVFWSEGNELLIIGGYRGYLKRRIDSIPITFSINSTECGSYKKRWECSLDSSCGWCPNDGKCYDKILGSKNCTTNLQTSICHGICPLLRSCQRCVTVPTCGWCESSASCLERNRNDALNTLLCQDKSLRSNMSSCVGEAERRRGVTLFEYKFPANWSHPDSVQIINSTMFSISRGESVNPNDPPAILSLKGYLVDATSPLEKLELCVYHAQANLTMAQGPTTNRENLALSIEWSRTDSSCSNLTTWSSGLPVSLLPGAKISIDLNASMSEVFLLDKLGRVSLKHNLKLFRKEHLLPYTSYGAACQEAQSCMKCAGDSSCLWDSKSHRCDPRMAWLTSAEDKTKLTKELILLPEDCSTCSEFVTCSECTRYGECEWFEGDAICIRKGRTGGQAEVILESGNCPTECHLRTSCSSCLGVAGSCVWCSSTNECFAFSVYTSNYQYGRCLEWKDKEVQCNKCNQSTTCEDCLGHGMGCGWNFKEGGVGTCAEGDFGGSYVQIENDDNEPGSVWTYTYDVCPDLDECALDLHECHPNSVCINTPGSYLCQCKQGYAGDGKVSCNETCFYECIYGTCSGSPSFTCECELGWTGLDCSMDCGCNFWSKCETDGAGTCDLCEESTTGPNCEQCVSGSYGNATLAHIGCRPCECSSGNGDPSRGFCDRITGDCFCMNFTTGRNCNQCELGYYGSPELGTPCYRECRGRAVMTTPQGYFGLEGKIDSRALGDNCLWIIQTQPEDGSLEEHELRITISNDYHVPCSENVLKIHSGLPSFTSSRNSQLVASICSYAGDRTFLPIRITVRGLSASILLQHPRGGHYRAKFNASYELFRVSSGTSDTPEMKSSLPLVSAELSDGTSVLSRFGHTLFVDDRNVWIFGGYSFSHGFLNDVRQFRRDVGQWIPLTITVVQNEDSVPLGRYFHAGVLGPDSEIFIHGGITHNMTFLNDFFRFDTRLNHWKRLSKDSSKQIRLAGHTLTLRIRPDSSEGGRECQLVIIGGMNPWNGFSDKVYVSTCSAGGSWEEVNTTGASPIGIYAHSTVYHRISDTFYIYGGIIYEKDEVSSSATLFSLHWPTKRWTLLPPNQDNQLQKLPSSRFFHSAVTTDTYLVVLGGSGTPKKSSLMVYLYDCNLWVSLGGDHVVERSGGGASLANNELMLMGGWDGAVAPSQLLRVVLPDDICSVHRSEEKCKGTLGCSFCSSKKNETRESRCYSSGLDMPSACSTGASKRVPVEFWRGVTCSNQLVLGSNNCTNLHTCSDCLSAHLNSNVTQACHWCTTCLIGKCLPIEKKCSEEHSCGQKPRETQEAANCPERQCSASECEKCTHSGKCIWTRQILRSSEFSFQLHSQPVYDWNCLRKTILDTKPSFSVSSSPPEACPDPCISYSTCSTCLESKGGSEGGFQECHWSLTLNRCFSPAHKWIICFAGVCGSILRGQSSNCPKPCSVSTSCASCLEAPDCGWCSVEGKNGEGECMTGNSLRSESNSGVCPSFNYNFLACPLENECLNNHHKCDLESENCIDLEEGFRCECRDGYRKVRDVCLPVCTEGCVHGDCVAPNKCSCHFGFVGSNCSSSCNCNSHSNCASETELDTCLLCHNNTMGPQCGRCMPLFVGDPKNGGSCIACSDYCNSHSEICLSWESHVKYCGNGSTDLTSAELKEIISRDENEPGPLNSAYCCSCNPESKTGGERCDICHPGYFRGTEDKRHPCRKCECNGHGNICNPISGTECNCNNNTESEICAPLVSKQGLNQQCWKVQCAKCREYYLGTPTNGHQCYRQMHVEQTYCFEPNSHEYCLIKPSPLKAGRTTFFAVQPKFMNVDIRINVDVTHGAVHMYLSPKEDTFVIRNDRNSFVHMVEFDTKYNLNGDRSDNYFDLNGTDNGISFKSLQVESFQLEEYEAAGFVTHVTVSEPKSVLVVRNIRNRLVVTLPQEDHDLRLTRFYMVLEGIGDGSVGSVFFRQDQLHIDLFVFFSVFFSAFFLFLAACGIAWKFKQNMEARQARHRHAAQMLSMAKRPFSTWTLIVEPDISSPLYSVYSQCRKNCRKGCICLRPVAIEMAQDGVSAICTMFVSLPGGSKAPCRLGLASSLATHVQSQTTHVISLRRRRI